MRILFLGLFLASLVSLGLFAFSGLRAPEAAGPGEASRDRPPPPSAPLARPAAGPSLDASSEAAESPVAAVIESVRRLLPGGGDAGDAPASGGGKVYYQWTDERGSVHIVDSLDAVPAEWRDRVGRIEMDARPPRARPSRTASGPRTPSWRSAPDPVASRKDVVVYSAVWCGWCRKTLAWLDERGIDYENRDIDANPGYRRELVRKVGGASIPVVEIDGQLVRGYDPDRMGQLLGS